MFGHVWAGIPVTIFLPRGAANVTPDPVRTVTWNPTTRPGRVSLDNYVHCVNDALRHLENLVRGCSG